MLVTNPLNAVCPEAIFDKCWALKCFAGRDLTGGKSLLHIIAAADRACRTRGQHHTSVGVMRTKLYFQHFFHRMSRYLIVPEIVAELIKLIEDCDVTPRTP